MDSSKGVYAWEVPLLATILLLSCVLVGLLDTVHFSLVRTQLTVAHAVAVII